MHTRYNIFCLTTFFLSIICSGQNLILKFESNSNDQKKIDSISYIQKHKNVKSIVDEVTTLKSKLNQIGYINATIFEENKANDSTFLFKIELKNQTKKIHIYIGKENKLPKDVFDNKTDILQTINFGDTEKFLQDLTNKIERKGYSQAKVNLIHLESKNNELFATLKIDFGSSRIVNDIVIVGYDKFPLGIKKNILKKYRNKTFSADNLKKISNDFDDFNFVTQPKYPEILFNNDTTKVYVYLQKNKANRFDGLIGFANDKNSKLLFNGYLDLLLVNTINSGEKFVLNWKSDGNKQTTFNIGVEIPYIFRTKLALKTNLNIFKQDSIFQNTKTVIDVGYLLNYQTKIFVGTQNTESTGINSNSATNMNFATQFTTLQFEHSRPSIRNNPYFYLFTEKSRINLKAGFGTRKTIVETNKQQFLSFEMLHNINFTEKFSLNLRTQNYYLQSKTYFINELHRFGGINSIRGFNENSLQCNLATILLTEFRYAATPSLYIYAVADYAFYDDKTTNKKGSLSGFGAGFGLLTKGGLINLVYANGNSIGQKTDFGNSIVHLSFKVVF